jgi:hypothetical protein
MTDKKVDQKQLAVELGVTVRRIRQMVDEHILPPPRDGKHDLERCERRYRLYKRGTDADWDQFYDEVLARAKDAERKFERALRPRATDAQIRAASVAHQDHMADVRFCTACKSRTTAERNMFLLWWDREDERAMSLLFAHAMKGKTLVDEDGTVLYEDR